MTGYDVFDRRTGKLVDTMSPFDMVDAVIERYVHDDASGVASLAGGNVVLDFVDFPAKQNCAVQDFKTTNLSPDTRLGIQL